MTFAYPHLLWVLPVAVLLTGLIIHIGFRHSQRIIDRTIDPQLHHAVVPSSRARVKSIPIYLLLEMLIVALLVTAAIRPRMGFTTREAQTSGVDVVFAVDVSKSMLADDIKPNRLAQARRLIIDMIRGLGGDRLALVSFAGNAFIEVPLTNDLATFRLFLDNLSPDLVPLPGTNIEAAVDKSLSLFAEKGPSSTQAQIKTVVVLTDGEALAGELGKAVSSANAKGVRIHTIGIGSVGGAPINIDGNLKKDSAGKVVVSRLNREGLKELAAKTGGMYLEAANSSADVSSLVSLGIQSLRGESDSKSTVREWNEYFQFPLAGAIFLLLVRHFAMAKVLVMVLLVAAHCPIADAQVKEWRGVQAEEAYQQGRFAEALKLYQEERARVPEDPRFAIGEASTLYRLKRYDEALKSFLAAAPLAKPGEDQARILFNAGNSAAQMGDLTKAEELYRSALQQDPKDTETAENLALVRKLRKEQEQESSSSTSEKHSSNSSQQASSEGESGSASQSEQASMGESSSAGSGSNDGTSEGNRSSPGGSSSGFEGSQAGSAESSSEGTNQSALSYSSLSTLEQLQLMLDNIEDKHQALIDFRQQQLPPGRRHNLGNDW